MATAVSIILAMIQPAAPKPIGHDYGDVGAGNRAQRRSAAARQKYGVMVPGTMLPYLKPKAVS